MTNEIEIKIETEPEKRNRKYAKKKYINKSHEANKKGLH